MEQYKRHRFGGLQYAEEFYRNKRNINIQKYQQGIRDRQLANTRTIEKQNLAYQVATNTRDANRRKRSTIQGLLTTGATTVDGFAAPKWAGHIKRFVKSKMNKGRSGDNDVNDNEIEEGGFDNDVPTARFAPEYAQPESAQPEGDYAQPEQPLDLDDPRVTLPTQEGDLPPASEVPGLAGQPAPPELGTGRLGQYEGGMNDYDIATFNDPEFSRWTDTTNIDRSISAIRQNTASDDPLAPSADYPPESATSEFGTFRYDGLPDFLRNASPPPIDNITEGEEDYGPPPEKPTRVQSLRRRQTEPKPEPEEDEDFGPAPDPPTRVQSLRRQIEPQQEEEGEGEGEYEEESKFNPEDMIDSGGPREPVFPDEDPPFVSDAGRPGLTLGDADRQDLTQYDDEDYLGGGESFYGSEPPDTQFPTSEELLAQEPTDLTADESTFFSRGLSRLFGLGSGRGGIAPEDMPRKPGPTEPTEEDYDFAAGVEDKVVRDRETYAEPEPEQPVSLNDPRVQLPPEEGAAEDAPVGRVTDLARPADVEGEGATFESADPVDIPQYFTGGESAAPSYAGDIESEGTPYATAAETAESGAADTADAAAAIGTDVAEAGAEAAVDTAAVGADAVAAGTAAIPGLDIITGAIGLGLSAAAAGYSIYNAIEGGKKQAAPKAPDKVKSDPQTLRQLSTQGPSIAGKYVGAETDNYMNATQHFSGF